MTQTQRLPYPGLRAFTRDESDLFFGRDGCIDAMVNRLAATRFLAVLGSSGSGKSSLVRTGLLDALDLGLHPWAGSRWIIVDFHPGGHPLRNLSAALLDATRVPVDSSEIDLLATFLRRGPRSLAEWVSGSNVEPGTNLLLLVDQFEELFRYGNYASQEEAEAFVSLLLETSTLEGINIHIVVTMRSEFLGASALLSGLAEKINAGLYLTPRMTRDECRDAIEGPASVTGFTVEPALVNRLLNDLSSFAPWESEDNVDQTERLARRADQLPLMQHVLNRLWARARSESGGNQTILKLADYDGLGGLSGAIDAHGEEILADPGSIRRRNIETVFRSLVSGTGVGAAVRRPCRLAELFEVTGDPNDVVAIVDAFRAPDCNFLRTSDESLTAEAIVDISHESLIRQWSPLRGWLENEARDADVWRRLASAQERYAKQEGGLLTGLDLQNLAAWWDSIHPAEAWAKRHGGQFAAVRSFLENSRRAEADRSDAARAVHLRERNRLRGFVAGLAVALILFAALGCSLWWAGDQLRDRNRALASEKHAADLERDLKTREAIELSNVLLSDEFRDVVGLEGLKLRVMGVLAKYKSTDLRDQFGQAQLLEANGEAQKALEVYQAAYQRGLAMIDALPPGQKLSEASKTSFLNDAYYYCWYSMDIGEAQRGHDCLESMKKVAQPYDTANATQALLVSYSRLENLEGRAESELEQDASPALRSQLQKSVLKHTVDAADLARKAAKQGTPTLEARSVHYQFVRNLALKEVSEKRRQAETLEACDTASEMIRKNPLSIRAITAHVECLIDDATTTEARGQAPITKQGLAGSLSPARTEKSLKAANYAEEKLQSALGGIDYLLGTYPGDTNLLLRRVDVELALADHWAKQSQSDKVKKYHLDAKDDFVKALAAKTLLQSQTGKVKSVYMGFRAVEFDKDTDAILFYKDIANAVAPDVSAFPKARSFTFVADDAADNLGPLLSKDPATQTESLKYLSGTIDRLNKRGAMKNLGRYSEDFDTYCHTYSRRLQVYAEMGQIDRMSRDLNEMKRTCLPIIEKYPWDIYARDPFIAGRSVAGRTFLEQHRYREALPELEYASHWVDAKASVALSRMYLNGQGVERDAKRGRELEDIVPGQHLTRYTIPADFAGEKYSFNFYVRDWPSDYPFEGIDDQIIWLKEARGGTLSPEVIDSFHKLVKIAKDNKVSFRELVVYALSETKDEAGRTDAEKAFDRDEASYKGAHTPKNLVALKKSADALYDDRVKEKRFDEASKINQELIDDADDLTRDSPVSASYRVAADIDVTAGDRAEAKDKPTAADKAVVAKYFAQAERFSSLLPLDDEDDVYRRIVVDERLGDIDFEDGKNQSASDWFAKQVDYARKRFEMNVSTAALTSLRSAVSRLDKAEPTASGSAGKAAVEASLITSTEELEAKDHSDAALREIVSSYLKAATIASEMNEAERTRKYLKRSVEEATKLGVGTPDGARTRSSYFQMIGEAQLSAGLISEAKASFLEAATSMETCIHALKSFFSSLSGENLVKVADFYGTLSYDYLLSGEFDKARVAAEEGLKFEPTASWIEGNQASALLLLGKNEEAANHFRKIRKDLLGKRSLADVTAEDFSILKKLGYGRPEMDHILTIMSEK